MVFDYYSTEEGALASFGCTPELRGLQEPPILVKKRGALSIQVREVESVTILDVDGGLFGESSLLLRDQVKELIEAKKRKIFLNLSDVTSIDNQGVGSLVSGYMLARQAGAQVKCTLNRYLIDMFNLIKLY